ncbi:MAG: transcriptional repressor [Oscillospiraceae bacterium]|nr:transcriptional repressor [Oscillospiraceae bacterium]
MSSKRNTFQRKLIFNAVKELNMHATAEQVYKYVAKQHPTISKATVYRNLNQMVQAGDLLGIGNPYSSTHYDHKLHEHYHFVCDLCEQIFNVEADLSDICNRLGSADGFDVSSYNISFSGLCWSCKAEQSSVGF